jgi:hypothetical protein
MDAHDSDMTLAWTIAMLGRQQKMPKLQTLLARRQTQPQTTGQMRTMLHMLGAQYGLKVRTVKGKRAATAHGR